MDSVVLVAGLLLGKLKRSVVITLMVLALRAHRTLQLVFMEPVLQATVFGVLA